MVDYPRRPIEMLSSIWGNSERSRDFILNILVNKDKAVPKHFHDSRSTAADLVFVPFKRIKAGDRLTLRHFENKAINDYNMIAAGKQDFGLV